jgi:hypothetical protein
MDSNNDYNITLPDLDEKIQFNELSSVTSNFLYNGLLKVASLEKYLSNNNKQKQKKSSLPKGAG